MQLEELGYEAKAVVKGNSIVVVTDENVEKLYLNRCMQSLKCAGFDVYSFASCLCFLKTVLSTSLRQDKQLL